MSSSSSQPPSSNSLETDLFDRARLGSNLPEFSVGELSKLVKKTVEDVFGLVRVRGEISECKFHSSGHVYITLKDDTAILASVCWRGQVGKLSVRPALGMEVVCTGRLTTYPGQSKYQLVIEGMALAGMGALLKMLEERKKKLEAEGLFDPQRKKALPFLPQVIGVVTSPTGAVIRDILHRLEDRFPRHVLVWPVAVQGEGAAEQIAMAIRGFNAIGEQSEVPRPDILIVARGGGSVEDLMPFNEEIVVRAAASSHIPLISAVGHETDTTLIDFASDRRAPTPTAAAEMAVPVRDDLLDQILEHGVRLEQAIRRGWSDRREKVILLARALGDPGRAIEPLVQRFDEKAERLILGWNGYWQRQNAKMAELVASLHHPRDIMDFATQKLQNLVARFGVAWENDAGRRRARISELSARLRHPRDTIMVSTQKLENLFNRQEAAWREFFLRKENLLGTTGTVLGHLSPRTVLGRGYVLVQNSQGHVVTQKSTLKHGDHLKLEFNDGVLGVVVDE